jgi:hypothetical protein
MCRCLFCHRDLPLPGWIAADTREPAIFVIFSLLAGPRVFAVPPLGGDSSLPPPQETFMPRATATAHIPLGSLTQRGSRQGVTCRACGSERVTSISMALTDGSPVEFTSCHRCEHRTWQEQGTSGKVLPVQHVLDKTRKLR